MVFKWVLRLLLAMALGGIMVALLMLVLKTWVRVQSRPHVYTQPDLFLQSEVGRMDWPAAIVFGAGYWPGGRPSNALADRLETAIELHQAGKVNKLLLTGDNRFEDYNEPAVMAAYLQARGIPAEDLVLDYAGRRTYDSCYRASAIFGLERAILVTQQFHLPRALFTCNQVGLQSVGVAADRRHYVRGGWYDFRELFATARAWLDVNVLRPLPVMGDPIPIDWDVRSSSVQ